MVHEEHIDQKIASFRAKIWDYYKTNGRSFAWRNTTDPYHIVVSEIMLQQTQTQRVAVKFDEFITAFKNFAELADAPQRLVLAAWQGLGYNRRGLALHAIAKKVISEHAGQLPHDTTLLQTFPGIGPNTAGSIVAFAFNKPTVFIETNIRTVFIEEFFPGKIDVHDKEILPLVSAAVDQHNPREWYYALMDYGVMLKKSRPNPSRKSAHYAKQSKFEGSDRQIRGMILKLLTNNRGLTIAQLYDVIAREQHRIDNALRELLNENFIQKNNEFIFIP